MTKQNKILIIIGGVVLVFALVVIFWPAKKTVIVPKTIKTIPASVVLVPTQDKTPLVSDTGAMKTILEDDQYKLMSLINILRNECPLKNDYFEIIYNYGSDKFEVTIKTENMPTFLQWKMDTGYNFISDKYWVIKNND
ncbi:MAG: hypothetical protein WC069_05485 [Candidatus Shapirobacteria bacterium]